jgi:hypothetical protein
MSLKVKPLPKICCSAVVLISAKRAEDKRTETEGDFTFHLISVEEVLGGVVLRLPSRLPHLFLK